MGSLTPQELYEKYPLKNTADGPGIKMGELVSGIKSVIDDQEKMADYIDE